MAAGTSPFAEYARVLASLEGNEFQAEVCARLTIAIVGFQPIPARPQGDGGLDGYSHGGRRGFCCYGPEHNAFKQNRSRESAIVKKFSADLLRLLELRVERGHLIHDANPELATILAPGTRLEQITLLTNWFESHRVLGPLTKTFATYKAASQRTFVADAATVVILGPTELANMYAVDELTIARAEQRQFMRKVQEKAEVLAITNPGTFDSKIQLLREIRPDQVAGIDRMSAAFQSAWRIALAFEQQLDESTPNLHRILEANREQIVARIAALMIASPQPWTQLEHAGQVAEEILQRSFRPLYNDIIPQVSSAKSPALSESVRSAGKSRRRLLHDRHEAASDAQFASRRSTSSRRRAAGAVRTFRHI